ncbi:carbohydrate binding domain-containing protein [Solirubrobacter phytolaccae]|uniref:Carbohydrate binding domain-containing protein n=1 Tax=Solirubrobacter phytolaccae TaxID=1404360 RepID=A0A9X3N3W3_9ACTN|nr:carbohydrate binding domain-containing protein [Solirubrobacter phytolaccae]MDA0178996.1 carbohydrate binding domain-containing protein [Solirubrobacter phytolaccae]
MHRLTLLAALLLTLLIAPAAAHAAGPNLLRNASFEQPSLRAWSLFGPGQGGTQTTPGVAREGRGYGIVQTSAASDTIAQDVSVSVAQYRSYSFSMWVRSASGRPFKGSIVLFGLSGPVEGTGTDFTADADWQLVTATFMATHAHTALRAQVDLHTAGEQLLLDGAQLLPVRLRNASFEDTSGAGWYTDGAALQISGAAARDGVRSGVLTAAERGGSLLQDQPIVPAAGEHYTYSAWVRSVSGAPVSGRIGLWATASESETGFTPFTAGPEWQLVTVTLRTTSGADILRTQVQLLSPGLGVYVDGAQLTQPGLGNASFEQAFFRSWDLFPRGPLTAASAQPGDARDGSAFGVARADAAGRSFAQDVAVGTDAGGSQTFSAWLRSPDSAGAAGSLVLTGTGGGDETASTPFSVGSAWTLVSVPLDAERAHSGLRAEVVLDTPGRELQVDGASLAAGNARDDRLLSPPVADTPPPAGPVTQPQPQPTPAPTPAAPRFVRSAVAYKWKANRRYTTVTTLVVRDVPENGWVELRCTGKGKGCPTTRTVTRKRIATTSFKTLFGKRKLKPGAQVEIRVLAPGLVGKVARFQIRKGKLPKVTFLCLAPGAKRPAKCA